MTTEHSELWLYIDRLLAGRSWRWLADQLPERVSDNTLRNWAEGRHPLKEFRADQLAETLGVHPNEIRRRAGLPEKDIADAPDPKPTTPAVAGGSASDQATALAAWQLVENMEREIEQLRELLSRRDDRTNGDAVTPGA